MSLCSVESINLTSSLSPSPSANILLDQNWRGVLTDFGIARTLSLETTTVVTQRIVGTRVYMSPEYCTGLVSPSADVYSLGVVSIIY